MNEFIYELSHLEQFEGEIITFYRVDTTYGWKHTQELEQAFVSIGSKNIDLILTDKSKINFKSLITHRVEIMFRLATSEEITKFKQAYDEDNKH